MGRSHAGAAALGVLLFAVQPAFADELAFYKGRQVNLVIAATVGGGYDLYGRLVARHIGKHIPGSPNVVPQNMLGGGGNTAAGFVLRDGAEGGVRHWRSDGGRRARRHPAGEGAHPA